VPLSLHTYFELGLHLIDGAIMWTVIIIYTFEHDLFIYGTYIPLTLGPRRSSRGISDILPKWLTYEEYCMTGGKPIALWLQPISGGDAINLLVAFYDIHGRKKEVLFFCSVSDTTRTPHHMVHHLSSRNLPMLKVAFKSYVVVRSWKLKKKYFCTN
jgi:hypothetical protein